MTDYVTPALLRESDRLKKQDEDRKPLPDEASRDTEAAIRSGKAFGDFLDKVFFGGAK